LEICSASLSRVRKQGRYTTLEVLVAPGNGPGPHVHTAEEESLYVPQGSLTISIGNQTFQAYSGILYLFRAELCML
jgi:mannose-6-phosphate isomerase-like protein (cupin superfamily)